MKPLLLLALGLAVTGCRQEAPHPEILTRLKALETELAKRPAPVRWATADREKLSRALFEQGRKHLEEFMQAEKVSPEQRAQIAAYEALNQQLIIKPRPPSVPTLPPLPPKELSARLPASVSPPTPPAPTVAEQEYAALAKRVAEAKAPVAALIERRAQITGKYYGREFMEQIIAEYAKDRFDLVVNSDRMSSYDRPLLYRTSAEAPDITEVLLQFFRDREKK